MAGCMIALVQCIIHMIIWRFGTVTSASILFYKREDYVLRNECVLESGMAQSRIQCVSFCEQNPLCESVSWAAGSRVCKLSDRNSWNVDMDYLGISSEYNTYTKPSIWKVWHMEGPAGRYTLYYSEAQALCAKMNGRLATEEEIIAERSLGYEMCACGWFAEGRNGFALQAKSDCWGSFSTRINYCDISRANAYCI